MATAVQGQAPVEDVEVLKQMNHEGEETSVVKLGFGVATTNDVAPVPIPINPPFLQVVHGVGALAQTGLFTPGSLVLAKENLVTKAGPENKIVCIVWDYRMYYKEYLTKEQFAAGNKSRIFQTVAEVRQAGLTTERNPMTGEMPSCPPAMTWLMLLEKPKDLMCDLFFLDVNGKKYAPALFGVDKSAFISVRDTFALAANYTSKPRGIRSIEWDLWTRPYKAKTGNITWVPSIKMRRALPDDELKAILEAARALGGSPEVTPA